MKLSDYGQIEVGDTITCIYNRKKEEYTALDILHPGTDHEEIIIDVERNKYFITSMAIDGSSWAGNVQINPI